MTPTFSERPANTERRSGPPAWSDVGMRLAHDGPAYAIIMLVGVLALRGQAESVHVVIAGLGALLSRSWPRPIQVGGAATMGVLASASLLGACGPW